MTIGRLTRSATVALLEGQARSNAQKMGNLVLQAQQLAASVISGGHGRRAAGRGDSFWQFRPYVQGLPTRQIDWRRSARGHALYIRDREWEIAQTVFLCPDLSPSMLYQSRFAPHSKEVSVLILTMALAEILTQTGERIALPGLLEPTSRRDGAHHVAKALSLKGQGEKRQSDFSRIRRAAHVIILSDFLEDFDLIHQRLRHLSERAEQIYLIEIADPAEEIFPYQGHVLFTDPENGQKFDAARAQNFAEEYKRLYLSRRAALRDLSRRHGWHFLLHITDQPLVRVLHHLHLTLGMARAGGRG